MWARAGVTVAAAVLALAAAACAGDGDDGGTAASDEPATTSSASGGDFRATLEDLCADLGDTTEAAQTAGSDAEFERRSRELLDAQRSFVSEASMLTAPPSAADAYGEYLAGVERFVDLNERSLAGVDDRRAELELGVEAAENGVATFEAKQEAELPESCPPDADMYWFLFQTQANLACFELSGDLARLGSFEEQTDTRAETVALIALSRSLGAQHARAIERSVPDELAEHPDVERLLELYEERVDALRRLGDAFSRPEEEAAYDRALERQRRLTEEADELAGRYGLGDCVGFVGVGG